MVNGLSHLLSVLGAELCVDTIGTSHFLSELFCFL